MISNQIPDLSRMGLAQDRCIVNLHSGQLAQNHSPSVKSLQQWLLPVFLLVVVSLAPKIGAESPLLTDSGSVRLSFGLQDSDAALFSNHSLSFTREREACFPDRLAKPVWAHTSHSIAKIYTPTTAADDCGSLFVGAVFPRPVAARPYTPRSPPVPTRNPI